MPKNETTTGGAPTRSKIALLIVDMISDFEFEDAEKLFRHVRPAAEKLAQLKEKAKRAKIPAIYINDNFGHWQSDFKKLLENALDETKRGHEIAKLLAPDEDDFFVLKPKHSAFFSTSLEILLEHIGAETLVLTGVATDICILFTANDAYMRDYQLIVPRDCVAANDKRTNDRTLKYLEKILKADTRASDKISF